MASSVGISSIRILNFIRIKEGSFTIEITRRIIGGTLIDEILDIYKLIRTIIILTMILFVICMRLV